MDFLVSYFTYHGINQVKSKNITVFCSSKDFFNFISAYRVFMVLEYREGCESEDNLLTPNFTSPVRQSPSAR